MQALTFTFAVPDDARLMIVPGTEAQLAQLGDDLMSILIFVAGQATALDTLAKGLGGFPRLAPAIAAMQADAVAATAIMDRAYVRMARAEKVEVYASTAGFTMGGVQ